MFIRKYENKDIREMIEIWNEVVRDGIAFPQEDYLDIKSGMDFFISQTYVGVLVIEETNEIAGLYVLHPNNIGRCGHLSNASYAVKSNMRGRKIGKALVLDSIVKAREFGFKILQFNAVVATNEGARHLYKKLGFVELGMIPGGFRMKNGHFEDIYIYYYKL